MLMLMATNCLRNRKLIIQIKEIGITIIPVLLFLLPLNWVENQHTVCIFKNLTGHECYGCGMTRAIVCTFHLCFVKAWCYNKLVIIVLPLLGYIWFKEIEKIWTKTGKFINP